MPTGQQYATNVPQTLITSQINPTATSMSVSSSSGWPATPFTAILELGTSLQEPIDVTNITGTTWTITRAIDGTIGFTHQVNATVTHGNIGRDFRDARSHIDASGPTDASGHSVHGLTAASSVVVGTNDTQTLTNKSLTAPTISGNVAMGSGSWGGTGSLTQSSVTGASLSYQGLTGATAQTSRIVGTVTTGAAPVSGTFLLGDVVYDTVYHTFWVCTAAGSPGTWLPMGNRASAGQVAASTSANTIPSWANTLRLTWSARGTQASGGGISIMAQLNGDTGSNYTWERMSALTGAVSATNSGGLTTSILLGSVPNGSDTANYFGTGEIVIPNLQSSGFKNLATFFSAPLSTTTGTAGEGGGTWQNTAAVTSITLTLGAGTFASGSTFNLEFLA